jgi:serine protease AprX
MIQMIRRNGSKIDLPLRKQLLKMYKPFRWTPGFLHKGIDIFVKHTKTFHVIVEFQDSQYFYLGMASVIATASEHMFCKVKNENKNFFRCSVVLTPIAMENLLRSCSHINKIHLDREVA